MKPANVDVEALNDPFVADETNLFYVCFPCRKVIQIGYGQVSSLNDIPCSANNDLRKGDIDG